MAVSCLTALSVSSRRRWTGVAALVVSVGLSGCLKPGGSGAATAGSGSTSGLSDGSTSQANTSKDPTATSASSTSGTTEGLADCLPDEVVRCRVDDEGECGPDSDCVHLHDCDPLLCDDPEIEWFPPCESTCGFGWSCTPSADSSLLRCTAEEPGECRPYEIYRCRLDADGECGPGSGCVDQRDCNPHLCVDPDTPSSAQDCESACGFGWDCSPSIWPSTLRCTSNPVDEGCDPWDQNCPEGYKCAAISNDGGSAWNATRCVPVVPRAKQLDEPCGFPGSPLEGDDDCDFGLMCWDVDYETKIGTCLALCGGTPEEPTCAEGSECSLILRDIGLSLCIDFCDPLAQDCPGDDLCIPNGESFICVLDASGEAGLYGDPCEYANACKPGLYCLNPEYIPDCKAAGCCTPFCDINAPNTCPGAGQVCIPWYEEGMAPPGFESVGICGLPQ